MSEGLLGAIGHQIKAVFVGHDWKKTEHQLPKNETEEGDCLNFKCQTCGIEMHFLKEKDPR